MALCILKRFVKDVLSRFFLQNLCTFFINNIIYKNEVWKFKNIKLTLFIVLCENTELTMYHLFYENFFSFSSIQHFSPVFIRMRDTSRRWGHHCRTCTTAHLIIDVIWMRLYFRDLLWWNDQFKIFRDFTLGLSQKVKFSTVHKK